VDLTAWFASPNTLFGVWNYTNLIIMPDRRPGSGGIWSTSFDVMGSGMVKVPVKLPFTAQADTMVCAFGFPGTMSGGLSQAFPVINKTPPPGRGRLAFTSDAPQGLPYRVDEVKSSSLYFIVGGMVVLGLCMVFFARIFWQKRMERKALQALRFDSENHGPVGGAKTTRYTDDL
jgi:hypothetical protein